MYLRSRQSFEWWSFWWNSDLRLVFFADILVLISRTRQQGTVKPLRTVHRFCCSMHMKLAVEKTVTLSMGPDNMSWSFSSDKPNLEISLLGKYLGIEIKLLKEEIWLILERRNDFHSQELCKNYMFQIRFRQICYSTQNMGVLFDPEHFLWWWSLNKPY